MTSKKRKPKRRRKPGRPVGGKSHPALRKYWRSQKRKQRAKKKPKKRRR